jgi:hypothetical protein
MSDDSDASVSYSDEEDNEFDDLTHLHDDASADLPKLFNGTRRRPVTPENYLAPDRMRGTVYRCREYPNGVYIDPMGRVNVTHALTGSLADLSSSLSSSSSRPGRTRVIPNASDDHDSDDESHRVRGSHVFERAVSSSANAPPVDLPPIHDTDPDVEENDDMDDEDAEDVGMDVEDDEGEDEGDEDGEDEDDEYAVSEDDEAEDDDDEEGEDDEIDEDEVSDVDASEPSQDSEEERIERRKKRKTSTSATASATSGRSQSAAGKAGDDDEEDKDEYEIEPKIPKAPKRKTPGKASFLDDLKEGERIARLEAERQQRSREQSAFVFGVNAQLETWLDEFKTVFNRRKRDKLVPIKLKPNTTLTCDTPMCLLTFTRGPRSHTVQVDLAQMTMPFNGVDYSEIEPLVKAIDVFLQGE